MDMQHRISKHCVQSHRANILQGVLACISVLHGVLAGISVSPEALTRNVIHLAWYIHTYSHIHMKLFFFTAVIIKLIVTILNLP